MGNIALHHAMDRLSRAVHKMIAVLVFWSGQRKVYLMFKTNVLKSPEANSESASARILSMTMNPYMSAT
jgi:hypothetical protein